MPDTPAAEAVNVGDDSDSDDHEPQVRARLADYFPYRERLVALARRRGLDRATAEDIAHDALIRVAMTRTPITSSPWPYLATAAANLVIDHYRRSSRTDQMPAHELTATARFEDNHADQDLARLAVQHLTQTEALDTLTLILLRINLSLTWEEIGTIVGIRPSTAQSRVRRALQRTQISFGHQPADMSKLDQQ